AALGREAAPQQRDAAPLQRHDTATAQQTFAQASNMSDPSDDRPMLTDWWIVRFVGGTLVLTAAFSMSGPIFLRVFARLPLPDSRRAPVRRDLPRLQYHARPSSRRSPTSKRLVG